MNEDDIIYDKINDILWLDWKPTAPGEEVSQEDYKNFVPDIFILKKGGADRHEIAKQLHVIETITIGAMGDFENCLAIADKILLL